ncbi:hypothetical protein WJ972_09935 [Achromobacter insuavis]
MLSLHPALGRRASQAPYVLPDLGMLRTVTTLALYGEPLAQPISLQGIERFAALEQLSLWGGFADWDALARLPRLKSLEIRFAPDLAGLPALDHWPLLERFIGFNVEDGAGKRLKAQLKAREKVRAWADYTSVSKLRKPEWWQSEYGRPFSGGAAAWRSRPTRPMTSPSMPCACPRRGCGAGGHPGVRRPFQRHEGHRDRRARRHRRGRVAIQPARAGGRTGRDGGAGVALVRCGPGLLTASMRGRQPLQPRGRQ